MVRKVWLRGWGDLFVHPIHVCECEVEFYQELESEKEAVLQIREENSRTHV